MNRKNRNHKPLFPGNPVDGYHVQLVLDILPERPLTQEEGQDLMKLINEVLGAYPVPLTAGQISRAHHVGKCDAVKCGGLVPVIEAIDQEYHARRKDEH